MNTLLPKHSAVAAELFNRSAIIRARVRAGKLKVVGALYDIKSERVNWLGAHPQQATLAKPRHTARHRD